MNNQIPVKDFLNKLAREEGNADRSKTISEAIVFFDTAIEKLEKLGHRITPMINTSEMADQISNGADHLSLSYTEAIRLLIIADFIEKKNRSPTLKDLAYYKSDEPTRDDSANEGRIVNLLESKELVIKDRSAGKTMNSEKLNLSESGIKIANSILDDAHYLRKVYNRSRNQRLREFILVHLNMVQKGEQIHYT